MNHKLDMQLKEIIAKSYKVDNEERQTLEKVLSHLAKYQEQFFDDLKTRIDNEIKSYDWNNDFNIVVKLINRDNIERRSGFNEINVGTSFIVDGISNNLFEFNDPASKSEVFQMAFFLDVTYDKVENFLNRKYEGQVTSSDNSTKKFLYTLRRHSRFIKKEKILFDIATLYKIKRPIIFSPYARRAVDIVAENLNEEDIKNCKSIDFCLNQNKLNGKLLTNCQLVWNITIEDSRSTHGEEKDDYIGADGNLIRYVSFHEFNVDEKVFVLPQQHCDDVSIVLDESGKKINLFYNSILKDRETQIIKLNDVEENVTNTFSNEFPKKNSKLRLRTEGDVEKVLSCFNITNMGQKFPASYYKMGLNSTITPVPAYRKEDSYFVSKEDRLLGLVRNKPMCYIQFAGDNESTIKIDYVNYVIYYMSQNYPEFAWVGVN